MNIWDEIKLTFKQGTVTTRICYVNLAIFLMVRMAYVFFALFKVEFDLLSWLALPSDLGTLAVRPWTLITYMFLHFDFLHILFNLLWLYWFGKIFTMYFDEKKLLGTYIVGGIFGGLFYIASYNLFPMFQDVVHSGILLGASASILAIVVAAAVYAPNLQMNLLLISSIFGPIKIIWIALASLLVYFLGISGQNAGGNIAHLGGAFWGLIYIAGLKRGIDFTSKFNDLAYNFGRLFIRKNKMRVAYRSNDTRRMSDWEYNRNKKADIDNINIILEKIGKTGYDSLTKHEKEVLFKMGNKTKGNT